MSERLRIEGGRPLAGEYPVQGNKNAALPLIAAALLAGRACRLENVPRIIDVENMVEILRALGLEAGWDAGGLSLDPLQLDSCRLPSDLVEKLRGSVLLLGALAARCDRLVSALPGGCPIGRRSLESHWEVFEAAGFEVRREAAGVEIIRRRKLERPQVFLEESSVTATENALILFASLGGGVIHNPAREPHVLALVEFLEQLGCRVLLHPLHFRVESGVAAGAGATFRVPPDYIDAGTMAMAAAVTGGCVVLESMEGLDFRPVLTVLERFGLNFRALDRERLEVSSGQLCSPPRITAGLWPSFPTDLVSLVTVLASQSRGLCLVHDWMYEGRMFFIDKLVRMGAAATMCDPHRVMVEGPKSLRGTRLESPDIRAGMALVVAGLAAQGETIIEHAEVIRRGYQDVAPRLSAAGASIQGV